MIRVCWIVRRGVTWEGRQVFKAEKGFLLPLNYISQETLKLCTLSPLQRASVDNSLIAQHFQALSA
jgi:hypothetical protein